MKQLFTGLPKYLSTSKSKPRSKTALSSQRQLKDISLAETAAEDFLDKDKVKLFTELVVPNPSEFPSSWNIVSLKHTNRLMLEEIAFDDDGNPSLLFGLTISENLCFQMTVNGVSVPLDKVKHINSGKIERHSDLNNLIAFLKSYSEKLNPEDTISSCVKRLTALKSAVETANPELGKKLTFLTEQLNLSKESQRSRRYSTSFLFSALGWQKSSPNLYRQLINEGILTLPSISYLKHLGSTFSLESGFSSSTVSYLKERTKHLTEREKTVALAMDEVNDVKSC